MLYVKGSQEPAERTPNGQIGSNQSNKLNNMLGSYNVK